VLRRATREPNYDPISAVPDPLEKIAVDTSHPKWLIELWTRSFGLDEATALARANNLPAASSFRIVESRIAPEALLARLSSAGIEVASSRVAPGAFRVVRGERSGAVLREMSADGLIYMQDEASQLVAHVVAPLKGERVLDLCSAPGSKTTHIASLASDHALIISSDLYEHRLRLVRDACRRLGVQSVRTVLLDATDQIPFADESFDRVLIDAPCSGTGTLRHNPEIRWRLKPDDIHELAAKQRAMLENIARVVRKGGRLVYSTCSVEREENEEVVMAFAGAHPEFKPAQVSTSLLSDSGQTRTWPHREDTDGFFVAAFEKR
jgi:16S rRNA (cytosine967-C5)-methyltransferase